MAHWVADGFCVIRLVSFESPRRMIAVSRRPKVGYQVLIHKCTTYMFLICFSGSLRLVLVVTNSMLSYMSLELVFVGDLLMVSYGRVNTHSSETKLQNITDTTLDWVQPNSNPIIRG